MKISKHSVTTAMLGMSLAISFSACNSPPASGTSNGATSAQSAAVPKCSDCGTITQIEEVKAKGDSSGVGAVAGAVVGAVIGHQVGDGRGQDVATVAGAVGGGVAGNEIEKRVKSTTYYHVTVAMENGATNTVDVNAMNGLSTGSKVRVIGNNLQFAGS